MWFNSVYMYSIIYIYICMYVCMYLSVYYICIVYTDIKLNVLFYMKQVCIIRFQIFLSIFQTMIYTF